MKYIYQFFSVIFFTFAAGHSSFASTLEETFKKRIPLDEKTLLEVYNENGNINISSWDKDEVEITAYKKVHASSWDSAKKMMADLTIEINEFEDKIVVETNYPKRNKRDGGFFSWLFGMGNGGVSVEYEIKIPKKLDLNLNSTNGGIYVKETQGLIRLETTNGKIEAEDITGSIRSVTTNGSIKAFFKNIFPDEDMSFKTTNGSIKIYLPEDTNAEIEARTTNGSVKCDLSVEESFYKSKRKLKCTINKGGPHIYLKTTNGSISIREN
jgi:DUF4097 and DUF4098 domain-containing protein YvlB